MMMFSVTITEILARTVNIEANTADEALEKLQLLYQNMDIVLDSGDFVNVQFSTTTPEGNTFTV